MANVRCRECVQNDKLKLGTRYLNTLKCIRSSRFLCICRIICVTIASLTHPALAVSCPLPNRSDPMINGQRLKLKLDRVGEVTTKTVHRIWKGAPCLIVAGVVVTVTPVPLCDPRCSPALSCIGNIVDLSPTGRW